MTTDHSIAEARCWTHNYAAELYADGEVVTYGISGPNCHACDAMFGAISTLADDIEETDQ